MEITAALVRELRERTSAGMMDCKRALTDAGGDMDRAIDLLRQRGLAQARAKEGRVAAEGKVAALVSADGRRGVLVEVNCETDFVARTEDFAALVADIAEVVSRAAVPGVGDGAALFDVPIGDGAGTVRDRVVGTAATVGENVQVRRFARFVLPVDMPGRVDAYVHAGGKIGALVDVAAPSVRAAGSAEMATLVRDLAMQVTAAQPLAVTREGLPADVVEREREVYRAQATGSGKPPAIVERMILGRLEKFYGDLCLVEQPFIKDQAITVGDLLARVGQTLGGAIIPRRFVRFHVGEGIAR